MTSWCPGLSLGYGDRLSIHQSRIPVSQSLFRHPWAPSLWTLSHSFEGSQPSLAELLRLWVLKFVVRSKSYLSNRFWQYTLCLPIVRALAECLQSFLTWGFCLSGDEVFNDELMVLKFWQHKFIWRLSFFLHTIFTWSDLPPPSHWLQGSGSRS